MIFYTQKVTYAGKLRITILMFKLIFQIQIFACLEDRSLVDQKKLIKPFHDKCCITLLHVTKTNYSLTKLLIMGTCILNIVHILMQ